MGIITWTESMDQTLRQMRVEGKPWDEVADALGVNRQTVLRRAKELDLPTGRVVDPAVLEARRVNRRNPRVGRRKN